MGFIVKSGFVIAVAAVAYWYFTAKEFNPADVRGKRVFVTGASQNIGEELAYKYARLGAKLVITARRETELKRVVKRCLELGAEQADYIVADMIHLNQAGDIIDKAVKILGGLDYLVLNHVYGLSNAGQWNLTDFHLTFSNESTIVNYLSYVHLSTHAIPHLTKSSGHLVVVSSLAGHLPTPFNAIYGANKAALNNFYGTLRLEMLLRGKQDYSITICLLGPIQTKRNRWKDYPQTVNIKGHPTDDTAKQIVEYGAMRSAFLIIPKWAQFAGILRAFATDALDSLFLKLFYRV